MFPEEKQIDDHHIDKSEDTEDQIVGLISPDEVDCTGNKTDNNSYERHNDCMEILIACCQFNDFVCSYL